MSRPARLLLVPHPSTAATRRHAFPVDEPLDDRGRAAAAAWHGHLRVDAAVTAPVRRCVETAALAGLPGAEPDPQWSDLDYGDWAGRELAQLGGTEPERLTGWLADPTVAPPAGETVTALVERVRAGMAAHDRAGRTTAVITGAAPVRAAVLVALAAPPQSLWRVDIQPGTVTVLHGRAGGWTVRSVNLPVTAFGTPA